MTYFALQTRKTQTKYTIANRFVFSIVMITIAIAAIAATPTLPPMPDMTGYNKLPPDIDQKMLQRAKWKLTEYKTADYAVACYQYKRAPLEMQNIQIVTKDLSEIIICGRYYTCDGRSYIDGYWNRPDTTKSYGIFQISNTQEGVFTLNRKKGGPLNITTDDIFLYEGRSNINNIHPVILRREKYDYILTIEYPDHTGASEIGKGEYFIGSRSLIRKTKFYDTEYLLNKAKSAKLFYNYGNMFVGDVTIQDNEPQLGIGIVYFKTGDDASYEIARRPDGNYSLIITYRNGSINQNHILVDHKQIEQYGYWGIPYHIKNGSQIKSVFNNGTFEGKYTVTDEQLTMIPTEGTYTFTNGDVFVGDLSGETWLYGMPLNGTLTLHDGTILQGNWFYEYDLRDEQRTEVENELMPSDKRAKARYFHNLNKFGDEMKDAAEKLDNYEYDEAIFSYNRAQEFIDGDAEREKLLEEKLQNAYTLRYNDIFMLYIYYGDLTMDDGRISEAVSSYTKAKEIAEAVNNEESVTLASDKLVQAEKTLRMNELTAKYGARYANLIIDNKFEVGMTKEMVKEIVKEKWYKIEYHSYSSGNKYEYWNFDTYRFLADNSNEIRSDNTLRDGMAGIWAISKLFGIDMKDTIKLPSLVFTNGKLTEIHY